LEIHQESCAFYEALRHRYVLWSKPFPKWSQSRALRNPELNVASPRVLIFPEGDDNFAPHRGRSLAGYVIPLPGSVSGATDLIRLVLTSSQEWCDLTGDHRGGNRVKVSAGLDRKIPTPYSRPTRLLSYGPLYNS